MTLETLVQLARSRTPADRGRVQLARYGSPPLQHMICAMPHQPMMLTAIPSNDMPNPTPAISPETADAQIM